MSEVKYYICSNYSIQYSLFDSVFGHFTRVKTL